MKLPKLLQQAPLPHSTREWLIEAAKFVVAGVIIVLVITVSTRSMTYNWQWYRVPRYIIEETDSGPRPGILLQGLWVTLQISGISLVLAALIGLVTALLRLSSSISANILARMYLELIRNTPLLIQIFFIYFIVSPIFGMTRFASAVLALSLFEGAYASEIIRGSILSVHRGQWESSYCLGLNTQDTYRFIILPQAIRRILPPLTSQAISLVKDSALVSTIAIYDLTMRGSAVVAETFLTFEIWFTVAAIYLAVTVLLSGLVRVLERKMKAAR